MNMTYVGDCDKQREVSGELQKGRNETKQCRSCHRTGTHKLFCGRASATNVGRN